MGSFTGLNSIFLLFFTEQDPPMFNIINFLSMSSHEFFLAGIPQTLNNKLAFTKNVKTTLRGKLVFEDKKQPYNFISEII